MWQVRREKILLYCRETPAGPRAGRSEAGCLSGPHTVHHPHTVHAPTAHC